MKDDLEQIKSIERNDSEMCFVITMCKNSKETDLQRIKTAIALREVYDFISETNYRIVYKTEAE